MSTPAPPSVEFIQGPVPPAAAPTGGRRRLLIFLAVLTTVTVLGEAWNFARTPTYRAQALVLTVKPRAADSRSEDVDYQHVAIQSRALMQPTLLEDVARSLNAEFADVALDARTLRGMFSITPVDATNLLELAATGARAPLLEAAVNSWLRHYENARQAQSVVSQRGTLAELESQRATLGEQIAERTAALAAFRAEHDIVSLERADNRAPAELRGLQQALNGARERLVEAEAARMAIDARAAQGALVIPREQRAVYTRAEVEARKLHEKLADLEERFTQAYIDRDPAMRDLPNQIRELESELNSMRELGLSQSIDLAEQELTIARAAVADIERRIAAHQGGARDFARLFAEHEARTAELARIEALANEVSARIAALEAQDVDAYPPVKIVDYAALPVDPVSPDYRRDGLIVLGLALVTALFGTWLFEYLSRGGEPLQAMTGVRVIGSSAAGAASAAPAIDALPHAEPGVPAAQLDAPEPRILERAEIDALLATAAPMTRCIVSLLLSGVQPEEFIALDPAAYADTAGQLQLARRSLDLAPAVAQLLSAAQANDTFPRALDARAVDDALAVAAIDAGIAAAARANGAALAHTYAVFLVRQGARLADLSRRLGPLPDAALARLSRYSPPGPNRPLTDIDTAWPLPY